MNAPPVQDHEEAGERGSARGYGFPVRIDRTVTPVAASRIEVRYALPDDQIIDSAGLHQAQRSVRRRRGRVQRGAAGRRAWSEIGVKNGLAQVTANISSERLTDDLRRQEPVKRSGWPRHQVHAASVRARSRTV